MDQKQCAKSNVKSAETSVKTSTDKKITASRQVSKKTSSTKSSKTSPKSEALKKKREQNVIRKGLKEEVSQKHTGKSRPEKASAVKADGSAAKADNRKYLETVRQIAVIAVELLAVILLIRLLFGGGQPAAVDTYGQSNVQPPVIAETDAPSPVPTIEPTQAPVIEAIAEVEPTAQASELPLTDLAQYTEGGLRLAETMLSEHPYSIYVSKETFTIAVLGIDENGEYTRLLRTWRTAIGTGNKTRAGNYKIDKKFLWYEWQLGGYTPYTSRLEGSSIRLHSPLHNENEDWESLYREGYRQIGSKETQGCLRTTTAGAAWVYYNCPIGTQVIIKNDDLYSSEEPPALGNSKSDPTRPLSSDDLEIPVTFFEVDSEKLSMSVGDAHTISLSGIQPALSEYEELDPIGHSFKYVSGNENVITVDENGVITAVGEGSAELLVIADDINRAYRIIEVSVGQN